MNALDRTAYYVAMHTRAGLAKPATQVPRAQPPTMLEAEYATDLVRMVDEWRKTVQPLLDELPSILAYARQHRNDEAELERRQVIGLPIVIENPARSVREWTDSDGTRGSTTMKWDYGFIGGVTGADGEEVDVYIGPVAEPDWIYIVHQRKKSTDFAEYDEDKVMLGWSSADDAERAYLAQYNDPRFFGGMTTMSRADFVARLKASDEQGMIAHRLDSSPPSIRVRTVTNRTRSAVTTTISRVPVVAVRTARRTADHQKNQFMRQTEAALGVKVPTLDQGLDQRIAHFVHENVALIQKLGDKTVNDIESIVARAFTTGEGADDVQGELQRRFDIAERHARFIAHDQMQKLYAQVTRMRHKDAGVLAFMWKTMEDPKVRAWHAVKDNKIFPYTGSRAPSFFPGDEAGCRCWEEPVFEGIKQRVADVLGKGRERVA